MAYYRFQLQAGVALRANVPGRVILIDDLGGAPGLDVMPNYGGRDLPNMPDRKKAFKFMEPFDGVTLKAAVDCNVGLFLSASEVSLGFADGSAVSVSGQVAITNGVAQRVPVDIGGGTVTVTADNVGINNSDAAAIPVRVPAGQTLPTKTYMAQTIANGVPVAVGAAAGALVAADVARRGLRVKNVGANAVALGGAGITFGEAVIVVQPGETWYESEAAGAAWYCTCDAGLASSLNIQTIA